jgi:hypothetical protein
MMIQLGDADGGVVGMSMMMMGSWRAAGVARWTTRSGEASGRLGVREQGGAGNGCARNGVRFGLGWRASEDIRAPRAGLLASGVNIDENINIGSGNAAVRWLELLARDGCGE